MIFEKGFTLFEVILYVAIFSIVAYFIGGFAYNLYTGRDRIVAQEEINTNGRFMLDTISSAVEQAVSVSSAGTGQ
jgi:Tfp pilus assembly protein PilE